MANGKPGDHPLTDIVVWNAKIFGNEIDDKIRRIYASSSSEFRTHLAALLYVWPQSNEKNITSPYIKLSELSYVLDTLEACVGAQR
jgi:hypothetical protein